ncbi:MAG: methionine--tRNA ligase subunit beta [Candidatus Harrisonbacteria bacterium]|nr:methionine--tRNA ligase subunit beta [Candidatus Harrisonbacteria bacterium]
MIPFDDFKKVELRVGKILSAERVVGSEKLLKLSVDFGSFSPEAPAGAASSGTAAIEDIRQVIAGIGKVYDPATLIGREAVFVANLEPRTIMGLESQGMILATDDEKGPVLLMPDREVLPGAELH